MHASHLINNEPFAILLADDLIISEKSCLQQLADIYGMFQTSVIGVNSVSADEISRYGVINPKKDDENILIYEVFLQYQR